MPIWPMYHRNHLIGTDIAYPDHVEAFLGIWLNEAHYFMHYHVRDFSIKTTTAVYIVYEYADFVFIS